MPRRFIYPDHQIPGWNSPLSQAVDGGLIDTNERGELRFRDIVLCEIFVQCHVWHHAPRPLSGQYQKFASRIKKGIDGNVRCAYLGINKEEQPHDHVQGRRRAR